MSKSEGNMIGLGNDRASAIEAAGCSAPLALEAKKRTVVMNGRRLTLGSLEWRVFEALRVEGGRVVGYYELCALTNEDRELPDLEKLRRIVSRLRRKVGASSIETIVGEGYRLVPPAPARQTSMTAK
jgi:DNA-binding response OmpR family regulator